MIGSVTVPSTPSADANFRSASPLPANARSITTDTNTSTLSSVVVSRGSQVQYTPQAFFAQSGPLPSTIMPKTTAQSAPARAAASRASVGLYRYSALATQQTAPHRYIAYAAGTWK